MSEIPDDVMGLIERLRARADGEREIQRNNEAVADALQEQLEAFKRRDGTHNNFAVRLGLEHRNCAKNDASLAKDWDEAADALASQAALIAEAREQALEEWLPIETASKEEGVSVLLGWTEPDYPPVMGFWSGAYHGLNKWCDEHYEKDFAVQPTHWRPLPESPRALIHAEAAKGDRG